MPKKAKKPKVKLAHEKCLEDIAKVLKKHSFALDVEMVVSQRGNKGKIVLVPLPGKE